MAPATLLPKYQIVIPKEIREKLGLSPGQKIEVIAYENRIELIPVRPIEEMRGFVKVLGGRNTSAPEARQWTECVPPAAVSAPRNTPTNGLSEVMEFLATMESYRPSYHSASRRLRLSPSARGSARARGDRLRRRTRGTVRRQGRSDGGIKGPVALDRTLLEIGGGSGEGPFLPEATTATARMPASHHAAA